MPAALRVTGGPMVAICERCGLEVAWDPAANEYVAEDEDDTAECDHSPPVGRHRAG